MNSRYNDERTFKQQNNTRSRKKKTVTVKLAYSMYLIDGIQRRYYVLYRLAKRAYARVGDKTQ